MASPLTARRHCGLVAREMVITLLFIAALVAIIHHFTSVDRATAQQEVCLSNLKRLGVAFGQYLDDHDGAYPAVYEDSPRLPGGRISWAERLLPYVDDRESFACRGGPQQVNSDPAADGPRGNLRRTRYCMNMAHGWHFPEGTARNGSPLDFPVHHGQLRHPAELGLLFESSNAWWSRWLPHAAWNDTIRKGSDLVLVGQGGETIYPRHNGGLNVLFCDGHAQWRTSGEVFSLDPYDRLFVIWAP